MITRTLYTKIKNVMMIKIMVARNRIEYKTMPSFGHKVNDN